MSALVQAVASGIVTIGTAIVVVGAIVWIIDAVLRGRRCRPDVPGRRRLAGL